MTPHKLTVCAPAIFMSKGYDPPSTRVRQSHDQLLTLLQTLQQIHPTHKVGVWTS